MNENFENELRRALRPLDAPAGFTEKVLRALPAKREPSPVEPRAAMPRSRLQRFYVPVAFAASLVVSILLGMHVRDVKHERQLRAEQEAGLAASRELMQALHVTSQKLDLAYQASKAPSPPVPTGEENRT